MKEKLYNLCDKRSIFVDSDESEEFVKYANQNGVHPSGGIMLSPEDENNPIPGKHSQCFYLDNPVSKEEALVIAEHHHLKGEVERFINAGYTPFDALAEWDLNG